MSGSSLADAPPPPAAAPPRAGSLGRELSLISAVKVVTVVLMVGQQALLARALGPAAKGMVDFYFLATYAVTEFGSLGIASGIVFLVTRRNVDPGAAHGVCLRFAAVLGVLAMGALALFGWGGAPPTYGGAVVAAALAAPPAIYLYYWNSLAVATGRAPVAYVATFGVGVLSTGSLLALWTAGALTATTAVAALAASSAAAAAACGTYALRAWGAAWSREAATGAVRYAARLYPGHAANVFHYRLDQYVVGSVLGPAALGVYALAARISEVFWYFDTVILSATLSRVARLPRAESWRLTLRVSGVVLAAGAAAVTGAWLLGPLVVRAVFGAEFAPAAVILVPLLVGAVAWSLARVVAQYLSYRLERPGWCTAGAAVAAAVNVAAITWLVQVRPEALTLSRVALVSMVSYSLLPVLYLLVITRLNRTPGNDE